MRKVLRFLKLVDEYGVSPFGILAGGLAIFLAVVCVVTSIEAIGCHQYGEQTARRVVFRVPSGCYVESGSRMVPVKEFTARAITNEMEQP